MLYPLGDKYGGEHRTQNICILYFSRSTILLGMLQTTYIEFEGDSLLSKTNSVVLNFKSF